MRRYGRDGVAGGLGIVIIVTLVAMLLDLYAVFGRCRITLRQELLSTLLVASVPSIKQLFGYSNRTIKSEGHGTLLVC